MTDLQSEMRAEYRKRRRWTNDFPTDETVDCEMSRTELGAIIEVLCRLRRLDGLRQAGVDAAKAGERLRYVVIAERDELTNAKLEEKERP